MSSSFKFIPKHQNLISTVDKRWLETFTETADINGPKLFLKYTSFFLCDKRKRRNARKSCTGLHPNFNLKFSAQRQKHVLASPSKVLYPLSFLDKFKLSCYTALLTFGEVFLTTSFPILSGVFEVSSGSPNSLQNYNSTSFHDNGLLRLWEIHHVVVNMDEKLEPIVDKYVRDLARMLPHVLYGPITKRQKQKEKIK